MTTVTRRGYAKCHRRCAIRHSDKLVRKSRHGPRQRISRHHIHRRTDAFPATRMRINSRAWMRWVGCWAEAATRSPGCRVVLGGERFLLALVAVAARHCGDGYLA